MELINKITKLSKFKIIGLFFIILYFIIVTHKVPNYGINSAIWYCDWIMLFSGIALLLNHRKSLSVFYLQSLLVQLPWYIDTLFLSIANISPLGVSNYLFDPNYVLFDFILSLRHYFVIPTLFIYFLYHKFYIKKSYHLVFNIITFVFIIGLSLLFTTPIQNVNCAFNPCINILPKFNSLITHLITFFVMLILIQFIILKPTLKLFNISQRKIETTKKLIYILFIGLMLITIIKYIV